MKTNAARSRIVAFSGGKDSTALVLRMAELGEDFSCLFTPTGNELPELSCHIEAVIERIQRPLILPPNRSLDEWIQFHNALPNFRMRWCTRQIKILPCLAYLKEHPGSVLCVGLRADEEERQGLYGEYATYRYPLREWGWGIKEVGSYLRSQRQSVPIRTDCTLCYDQRLDEWFTLWRDYPDEWAKGEAYETQTGHTFRSDQRDTWPAGLQELGRKFAAGYRPRGTDDQIGLWADDRKKCRVCEL